MLFRSFEKADRHIVTLAALALVLSSLLLWQDDWIYRVVQIGKGQREAIGEVRNTKNDVRRRFEVAMSWLPLKSTNTVYQGDSIFTGEDSSAVIVTKSGEEITIAPNSLVVINQRTDSISINIGFGSVKSKVEKGKRFFITKNDNLTEVTGDNAIVNIDAGEGNRILLNVVSGEIQMRANGQEQTLSETRLTEIAQRDPAEEKTKALISLLGPIHNQKIKYHEDQPLIFKWEAALRFNRAKIKIARDPEMQNVVLDSRVDGKHFSTYSLPKDTDLFWQVLTERGNSETYKFSLIGDTPPNPVSPKPGSQFFYNTPEAPQPDALKIQLTWAGGSIAEMFEVQIAKDFDFKKIVDRIKANGHETTVSHLNEGTYYWRVRSDEFPNEKWSETSQFRVGLQSSQILVAPIPHHSDSVFFVSTKIHGLNYVKVHGLRKSQTQKFIEAFPTLTWSGVKNAEHYQLQISKNPTFTDLVLTENLKQKSFLWKDIEPGDYHWRIRGVSESFKNSQFTRAQNLKIALAPPQALSQPLIIDEVLDRILLNAPPPPIRLMWNPTVFTTGYEIEFADNSEFRSSKRFLAAGAEESVVIPKPGIYYWRIRSLGQSHVPLSPFSSTYTLEFQRVYKDPALTDRLITLEPKDQDSIILVGKNQSELKFKWNRPFKDVQYRIEMSNSSSFENIFYSATTTEDHFTFGERFLQSVVYWRIRAENEKFVSAWTPPSRFFVTYSEQDFDFEVSEQMFFARIKAQERQNLIWAAHMRRLSLMRSPASKLEISLDTPKFTESPEKFTLISTIHPSISPEKIKKMNIDQFVGMVVRHPTFSWQKVTAAEKYIFEIAKDPEFKNLVVKLPTFEPEFTWSNSVPGRYFYRLRAHNERYRPSPYSEVKSLEIGMAPPTPASAAHEAYHSAKINRREPQSLFVNFSWSPVAFARSYQIELSTTETFDDTQVYKSDRSETKIHLPTTEAYYWRVRALNSHQVAISPYSEVQSLRPYR